MKKIIILLVVSAFLTACYDDYVKDFDYDGIYFPYQTDVRTVVVGEGMKFEFGVALGGVMENTRDRLVQYQIDNSLISSDILTTMKSGATYIKTSVASVSELKVLPANYYTLSDNSKFIIRKGEHSGTVVLKPDSARFLADALTLNANYAIALRITSADADTILESKDYAVIGVKYENMLFGNYWHGGVTVEKTPAGVVVNTVTYKTAIPSPDSKAWVLSTVEPMSVETNGVSDLTSPTKSEMKLTINGANVTIGSVPGATFEVQPNGTSTFNQAKLLQDRKIFLNYKYVNAAGNTCIATDTLTFRNRIRDGVNEWQDENPSHYN